MDDPIWKALNDSKGPPTRTTDYSEYYDTVAFLWRLLLGFAAFLDCLATALPRMLSGTEPGQDDNIRTKTLGQSEFYWRGRSIPDFPFGLLIQFLDQHRAQIGFCLSFVCAVHAVLDAHRSRNRALIKRDRLRLLKDEESFQLSRKEGCGGPGGESSQVLSDQYLVDDYNSRLAFYERLAFELLMLPTGFYWIVGKWLGTWNSDQFKATFSDACTSPEANSLEQMNYSLIHFVTRGMLEKLSILVHDESVVVKRAVGKSAIHIVRKVAHRAIRNPIVFVRRIKQGLIVARWFKYIQPIFGNFNKFKANWTDLLKKKKQKHDARIAQKVRRQMVDEMTIDERKEYAARTLQKVFRGNCSRKAARALRIIQCREEVMAAIKLQSFFRAKLERSRLRVQHKRQELEVLRAKLKAELQHKQHVSHMQPKERKRLYELELEMQLEAARLLNQRMLLKPNTTFAVAWKFMFCTVVLIEITCLALNPLLNKYKDDVTEEPVSIHSVLERTLVPLPVSKMAECACHVPETPITWKSRISHVFHPRRGMQQSAETCNDLPWFCGPPYSTARSIYISFMQTIMNEFMVFVSLIAVLDVPIFFFTGEIDEATGAIKPKPFVSRWITPGLVLQLLVNPKMATTSQYMWRLLQNIFNIGPVRVMRWATSFFLPLFMVLIYLFETKVWAPFVSNQNQKSLFAEARSRVVGRLHLK